MKFSTRQDIEAPIDYVFLHATEFAAFEKQALRRGAQVTRLDGDGPYDVGAQWDVVFTFRSKERKMQLELITLDDPNLIRIDTTSPGLKSKSVIEFVSLSPKRTRISVNIALTAKTLPARLMVQSLKLAKSSLDERFAARLRKFAEVTEADYRQGR